MDPHSPVHQGFWYAHCGWYLQTRSVLASVAYALAGPFRLVYDALVRPMDPRGFSRLAPDIAADPWIRFMSTRSGYALFSMVHLIPSCIAGRLYGGTGVGVLFLVQVLMYNAGDAINSLSHLWGHQSYSLTPDASRNNRLMAVFTLGEGWHNNHHAFPYSARAGFHPGEWDLTWWFVCQFQRWGWIEGVRLPPDEEFPTVRRSSR